LGALLFYPLLWGKKHERADERTTGAGDYRFYATTRATVNSIIVGVLTLIVSTLSAMTYSTIPNWVHVIVGIWLVVAPYALMYGDAREKASAWNSDFATGSALITLHFAIAMAKMSVNRTRVSSPSLEGAGWGPKRSS
jgi:hypothetical protein